MATNSSLAEANGWGAVSFCASFSTGLVDTRKEWQLVARKNYSRGQVPVYKSSPSRGVYHPCHVDGLVT